ncbi:DUF2752 domain-containing protein [Chryseosolibacter indicus]|uniref:DUF2752 domain-containing protein n=1 Tax=Chryseosolibacter indicus TaxID=2782351 RepID=A0ABS5VNP4_9BACT|nr:DUF2752 domain-containing protein [Chryseosolibacter indicus]MBT1702981.1 DUF2752 domain-containing protein [Chryseosolibacter indicus]
MEGFCWVLALVALAFYDCSSGTHFTICPLAFAGIDWCPGCGLGRSISLLFHGEIKESITMHPLGMFAVIILIFRIFILTKNHFKTYGSRN